MTTDLETIAQPRSGVTQATAVEQARAVAEVAAAVRVARDFPRDIDGAYTEMQRVCASLALAEKAFYSVPNRGEGPSVHLARELARIWGNTDYGVHEIRRDDDAGMSEIRAFSWDIQTNSRSTRTFQVPHQRMARGRRQALIDLTDVYLNNQNIGARAVRECIFNMLPGDFTAEAERLCRETLARGDGTPLDERIANMVSAYGRGGITQAQLEQHQARPVADWDEQNVASLTVLFESLRRGDAKKEDEFSEAAGDGAKVTTGEITARADGVDR